ncbi:MAG: orotidine-5'-phosphate decarboxylase [Candidatus Adiutrix sp.]|jgi:orotidine-5'-phosphate decarboxylase|nr:orotidine-5'-phosphate decarboxylase [Candidatus Adiutrix sp.]
MTSLRPLDRLIFPLDLPDWTAAEKMARALNGHVGWFKVGLELFIAAGPSVLARLRDLAPETKIFLDLKLHDIPATVGLAAAAAAKLGPEMLTVHAQGGLAMMKAAVDRAGPATVLAVTVLTSLEPDSWEELAPEFRAPAALVRLLAGRAQAAGCGGLVASGQELSALRTAFPGMKLVVPGLRPAWAKVAGDDQKRTATPREAVRDGADFLVIGRPIRDAPDPAEAADRLAAELAD